MVEKLKERTNKGITLIALVITVAMLLILAGVTILTLTGKNGILNQSQTAKEKNNKETATEIMNLKITNAQIQSYSEKQELPTLQYLANRFCEDGDIEYVQIKDKKIAEVEEENKFLLPPVTIKNQEDSILTKLKEYPYEFEIDGKLRLASIDGVEIADNKEAANYQQLKEEVAQLKQEINTLKNEKSEIKRTKLTKEPINISLKGIVNKSWVEGDFANVTLLDSIENYKYLAIDCDQTAIGATLGANEKTRWVSLECLKYNNSNKVTDSDSMITIEGDACSTIESRGIIMWFKDNKTLYVGAAWCMGQEIGTFRIRNIYGIK